MIIFESISTPFEASSIFRGSWGSFGNWLKLKIEPPEAVKHNVGQPALITLCGKNIGLFARSIQDA
jgi:hypothetical protein